MHWSFFSICLKFLRSLDATKVSVNAVMDEPALECSEEVMQKISELEDLLARE